MVADIEEQENFGCSKTQCEGGSHAKKCEHLIFLIVNGPVKWSGRD